MTFWCSTSLCVLSWRSLLYSILKGSRRGKCLSILTSCKVSVTWGMLLVLAGLVGAVLHVRSKLSCRLCVWICFKAVSLSENGFVSGRAITCVITGAGCHLRCLTGYKFCKVSFRSSATTSGIGIIGSVALFLSRRPRLLFSGAGWLTSRSGKAVDLFRAITAGGSRRMLALAAGPDLSVLSVNRLGIASF